METFEKSTRRFLRGYKWTDEQRPLVTALLAVAIDLDNGNINGAMVGQYRGLYDVLMKVKAEAVVEGDDPDLY